MGMKDDAAKAAEGGDRGGVVEEGYHLFTVVKCVRQRKDGSCFETKKGDPSLMVVLVDEADAEGTCFLNPVGKAQWKFLASVQHLGVDLDSVDERGLSYEDFLDAETATRELAGLTAPGYAEASGQYMNIDLLGWDEVKSNPERERLQAIAATRGIGEPVEPLRLVPDEPKPPIADTAGAVEDGDTLPF